MQPDNTHYEFLDDSYEVQPDGTVSVPLERLVESNQMIDLFGATIISLLDKTLELEDAHIHDEAAIAQAARSVLIDCGIEQILAEHPIWDEDGKKGYYLPEPKPQPKLFFGE